MMVRGYWILFILLSLKCYAQNYYSEGVYYFEMKDYNTAILKFTEAIKNNINLKDVYHQRGRAYYRSEEYHKASMDADISCYDYNFCLLREYMVEKGMYRNTSQFVDRQITENTETNVKTTNSEDIQEEITNFYKEAMDYMENEDYKNAFILFTKEIENNPNHIRSYIERGKIYTMYEKYDKAMIDAQKACELGDCKLLNYLKNAFNRKE